MNAGMKMMMLSNARNGGYEQADNRMGYGQGKYSTSAYSGYNGAGSRFLDRSGKGHYDNGQFVPMRNDGDMELRMGDYEDSMIYGTGRMASIRNEDDAEWREHRNYNITTNHGEQENANPSKMQIGFASGEEHAVPFSQMTAEKWVRSMENEDGSKSPHWSMEQIKSLMAQKGVNMDPWKFYAAMNAIYSDFSKAIKKNGVGDKIDLYIDMAKAFIEDKDAQPDKLARYFQYVVKH